MRPTRTLSAPHGSSYSWHELKCRDLHIFTPDPHGTPASAGRAQVAGPAVGLAGGGQGAGGGVGDCSLCCIARQCASVPSLCRPVIVHTLPPPPPRPPLPWPAPTVAAFTVAAFTEIAPRLPQPPTTISFIDPPRHACIRPRWTWTRTWRRRRPQSGRPFLWRPIGTCPALLQAALRRCCFNFSLKIYYGWTRSHSPAHARLPTTRSAALAPRRTLAVALSLACLGVTAWDLASCWYGGVAKIV